MKREILKKTTLVRHHKKLVREKRREISKREDERLIREET